MWRLGCRALAPVLIAACSSTVPAVSPRTINGHWGGPGVQLSDSVAVHGIVLSFRCTVVLFPGPIAVDSSGSFAAEGVVVWSTWSPAMGRAARIAGSVDGHTMQLEFTEARLPGQWSAYAHYTLSQRQAADWSGIACAA